MFPNGHSRKIGSGNKRDGGDEKRSYSIGSPAPPLTSASSSPGPKETRRSSRRCGTLVGVCATAAPGVSGFVSGVAAASGVAIGGVSGDASVGIGATAGLAKPGVDAADVNGLVDGEGAILIVAAVAGVAAAMVFPAAPKASGVAASSTTLAPLRALSGVARGVVVRRDADPAATGVYALGVRCRTLPGVPSLPVPTPSLFTLGLSGSSAAAAISAEMVSDANDAPGSSALPPRANDGLDARDDVARTNRATRQPFPNPPPWVSNV